MAESASTDIGLGPVLGVTPDRKRGVNVPLRTPAAFVAAYGRGYKAQGNNVVLANKAGTQFWHPRPKVIHKGEDLYFKPGVPIYAPFTAVVEAMYPASRTVDLAEIVVLRSTEDGRIKSRIVHIRRSHDFVRVGQVVKRGQQLGVNYTSTRKNHVFPEGDPAHIHLEAIVYDTPGAGSAGDKGTHQPLSIFDAEALIIPKADATSTTPHSALLGMIAGVALGLLYLLARYGA